MRTIVLSRRHETHSVSLILMHFAFYLSFQFSSKTIFCKFKYFVHESHLKSTILSGHILSNIRTYPMLFLLGFMFCEERWSPTEKENFILLCILYILYIERTLYAIKSYDLQGPLHGIQICMGLISIQHIVRNNMLNVT